MGINISFAFEHPENDNEMRKIFEHYDKNGNNYVDKEEFEQLRKDFMKYISKRKKETEVNKMENLPNQLQNEINKIEYERLSKVMFRGKY